MWRDWRWDAADQLPPVGAADDGAGAPDAIRQNEKDRGKGGGGGREQSLLQKFVAKASVSSESSVDVRSDLSQAPKQTAACWDADL